VFELLLVTASRSGVSSQLFAEEPASSSAGRLQLQQPAAGWPLGACHLPGVLSMQVVLEEGPPRDTTAAAAAAAAVLPPPAPPAAGIAAGTSTTQQQPTP
jgi:hypothetical protein